MPDFPFRELAVVLAAANSNPDRGKLGQGVDGLDAGNLHVLIYGGLGKVISEATRLRPIYPIQGRLDPRIVFATDANDIAIDQFFVIEIVHFGINVADHEIRVLSMTDHFIDQIGKTL